MGVVYKAQDTRLGRSVALKFLPQEFVRDPQRLERFRREARTASALNHPHICTIYDIGEYEGQPFLVMELIEGRTLRALAALRPPLPELVHLVGQVAKALAAAHAAGIVHRDIKPENIMVRDDGYREGARLRPGPPHDHPRRAVRSHGRAASPTRAPVVGTLLYMSPEQARAEPVGSASDIFSLGMVLYELATGQHPFPADSQVGDPARHLVADAGAAVAAEPGDPRAAGSPDPAHAGEGPPPPAHRGGGGRGTGRADREGCRSAWLGRPPSAVQRHTVGRQQELAALRAGFEEAAAGRGLLLCVTGEPGLGKTTLVENFLDELAASGRTCTSPAGAAPSAWPAPRPTCRSWRRWTACCRAKAARPWPRR